MFFQPWHNFYILCGTAAATLAGLLYLGLSSSVGMLGNEAERLIRIWINPLLNDFLQVLIVSALVLFPGMRPELLAYALIALVCWRIWRLKEVILYLRGLPKPNDLEFEDWLDCAVYPALIFLAAVISAIGLLNTWPSAMPIMGLHIIALLILGIKTTWRQLVWMTVQRHQSMVKPPKKKRRS